MKFLLDHDAPAALTYLLRERGHDVSLLRDVIPTDTPDAEVLQFAIDKQAVLVTCNRDDFIELGSTRHITGLSSSFGERRGPPNSPHCSDSYREQANQVYCTT